MTSHPHRAPAGAPGMTMSDQLARHARTRPDTIALRYEHVSRTYGELDERVSRLSHALSARGVGAGERVAVLGLNCLEVIETYFACTRLGAACVPVNFRLVADEVAYVLTDSGASALVVGAPLAETAARARRAAPEVRTVLTIGGAGGDYEHSLAAASAQWAGDPVDESSPAFIMYTSGTTGRPKGAVLTHRNLMMHTFSYLAHVGGSADDLISLVSAPLFHIAGVSGLLPHLMRGGTSVLAPSGNFDPSTAVDLLERERITSCFFVPSQWQAICALPDIAARDLSALRTISWGAAPASPTLIRSMIDTFPNAQVLTAFGQTECCPVTCLLRGEDAVRKIGSVGTPMLNVEVRVVDDAMKDVPQGAVGEIVYRSPMVMKEYWNRPAETAEAFAGGWFHSGDLVREDEDGYLFVVDRKKDMIISGGENIYCTEVEHALAAHPKVVEVAVVGIPHATWGETPLAVIVARNPADPPSAAEIRAWCVDRLAGYKRPREVSVVSALPRNPSGKVLKTQLRSEHAAGMLPSEIVG